MMKKVSFLLAVLLIGVGAASAYTTDTTYNGTELSSQLYTENATQEGDYLRLGENGVIAYQGNDTSIDAVRTFLGTYDGSFDHDGNADFRVEVYAVDSDKPLSYDPNGSEPYYDSLDNGFTGNDLVSNVSNWESKVAQGGEFGIRVTPRNGATTLAMNEFKLLSGSAESPEVSELALSGDSDLTEQEFLNGKSGHTWDIRAPFTNKYEINQKMSYTQYGSDGYNSSYNLVNIFGQSYLTYPGGYNAGWFITFNQDTAYSMNWDKNLTVEKEAIVGGNTIDTVMREYNLVKPETQAPTITSVDAVKTGTNEVQVSVQAEDNTQIENVTATFNGQTYVLDELKYPPKDSFNSTPQSYGLEDNTFQKTITLDSNPSGMDYSVTVADVYENDATANEIVAVDSYLVGQSVSGDVVTGTTVQPDYNHEDGSVRYYFTKSILTKDGNIIDQSDWNKVNYAPSFDGGQTVDLVAQSSIDRTFDQTGDYSYKVLVAKANSTYNWNGGSGEYYEENQTERSWSDYDVSQIDEKTYAFQVVQADQTDSPLNALQNFFDSVIDDILGSIGALFDENPTALPEPDNPPAPA